MKFDLSPDEAKPILIDFLQCLIDTAAYQKDRIEELKMNYQICCGLYDEDYVLFSDNKILKFSDDDLMLW